MQENMDRNDNEFQRKDSEEEDDSLEVDIKAQVKPRNQTICSFILSYPIIFRARDAHPSKTVQEKSG